MYDVTLLMEKLVPIDDALKTGDTSGISKISAQHIEPGYPLAEAITQNGDISNYY